MNCVSILMPLARIDSFFSRTLVSVRQQTFSDYELIIVCPIEIEEPARQVSAEIGLAEKVLVQGTSLGGVAFAANLAISLSSGKYIARWDSDDLCDKNRLEEQVNFLEKNRDVGVVGTRVVLIDEKEREIANHTFPFFQEDSEIRKALKYRQSLLHSSLMFRRKVLFDAKGYLYGHTSEDHEMFIRIARNERVKFHNLPNVTTYYRRHSQQLSDYSNRYFHFAEISGFLFSEWIRTFDFWYIVGMIAIHPIPRRLRQVFRALRGRREKHR